MNHHRSPFAWSTVALAASLALAACGGGDAEAPPKASATTPTPTVADTTPPTVTISDSVSGTMATGDVTFTFTFSEDVGISFTADDISVSGGTKGTFLRVGTTQATLVVTPTPNTTGTINVSVAAGAVRDLAGNASAGAASAQRAFDTVPPVVATKLVSFQESTAPVLTGFGGAEDATVVTDPTDATNKVAKVVKSATAELWAGTTVSVCANQAISNIPFSSTNKKLSVRVWSPVAGIPVRLKVEDAADGSKTAETEALTTKASQWETLTFDFATVASGTAALNLANTYNKASVFFDFGKTGAQAGAARTYYFDDLSFVGTSYTPACPGTGGGGGGGATTATISFDESTAPTLTGFGGAEDSTVVADPTNAANKVAKVVKSATAELWAGTTVSTLANQAIAKIGFAAGTTTITARVWSPDAGIPVRMKVEDATDGTKSVETEATTTVAGAWQTLSFNFANAAAGTAALNLATNYNKLSVFFNFGQTGAQAGGAKTYYLDDIVTPAAAAGGGGGGGTATPVTFSTGFGATATVQGGAYGGYSGSNVDGFNCGAPASCGNGGSFTPGVAAADSGYYYYYQTPTPATGLYAGVYIQAPGLTTGLSATGDTPGVQLGSQTTMKFNFGQNPEWFASATKNFGVILTLGKFYNVGSVGAPAPCNIKLLAVVTPTAAAASAYAVPLNSFGLIQTCGVGGLTVASALALAPVSQIDFQATGGTAALPAIGGKTVGANLSVASGSPAVYPTTLVINGGISFE